MSKSLFQCIRRRIIDKASLQTPIVSGSLQEVDELPFCLKTHSQVGIVICSEDDQDLVNSAPDGVVYELEIAAYCLKDVALGAVAGNILFEQISRVVAHKVDGKFIVNNISVGAFEPNAFIVSDFVNPLGLNSPSLTSF